MAEQIIPLTSEDGNYSFDVKLGDSIFNFTIYYNTRSETWVISLYDSELEPIFQGLNLVLGYEYLYNINNENKPYGFLFLINIENENEEPTRDNLGTDCLLVFIDG